MNLKKTHILLLLLTFMSVFSYGQNREYLIKSAIIKKIIHFIEWPEGETKTDSLIIGVYTKDTSIFNTLNYYFQDQSIHNKYFKADLLCNTEGPCNCDIIFLASDYHGCIDEIIKCANENAILLITEDESFDIHKVHINLIQKKNKLRYEINKDLMTDSGFYVSSKLYSYAENIIGRAKE